MWGRALVRSRRLPGSGLSRSDERPQGRGTAPAPRSARWIALLAAALLAVLLSAAMASASGGGQAPPPQLPADFPSDIPLPPGTLQGSTGGAGRWSVLLVARGSAAEVLSSTESFYVAAGFSRDGYAILHRGSERITIVAENRDHSATQTNLTLGVTTSASGADPAAGPVAGPGADPAAGPVARILPGRGRVSLAAARRSGLRVRFTAPAGAAGATVREYRTAGGRRQLVGARSAAVHGGTNAIALDAPAVRRRAKPGLYTLEVVLHGAGATQGPPARAVVRVVR
jgi:hypothetical protein